jgi:hypothetical protein
MTTWKIDNALITVGSKDFFVRELFHSLRALELSQALSTNDTVPGPF